MTFFASLISFFSILLNTLRFDLRITFSVEFNGLDKYCLHNLSLNLIDLRIFSVIHDLSMCLCLLNLIVFVGRNVSFASVICFSIMS